MLNADKLVKLSYDMSPHSPVPSGIPCAEVVRYYDIPHDGGNVWILKTSSHTGTHIDAPNHMLEDGIDIGGYALPEFLFDAPLLIDLPLADDALVTAEHLYPFRPAIERCDFLMFRTGWADVRAKEPARYMRHSPGFSCSAAEIVAQCSNVRAVGADFLSFAAPQHVAEGVAAHKIMMRALPRVQLYEDMYLPAGLGELSQVLVAPWVFSGTDSAPCTIYGIVR